MDRLARQPFDAEALGDSDDQVLLLAGRHPEECLGEARYEHLFAFAKGEIGVFILDEGDHLRPCGDFPSDFRSLCLAIDDDARFCFGDRLFACGLNFFDLFPGCLRVRGELANDGGDEVVVPFGTALHGDVGGVLAAQAKHLPFEFFVIEHDGCLLHAQRLVIAEVYGGANGHGGLETHGFQLEDFQFRLVDGVDIVFFDGVVIGVGNECIERFANQSFAPDHSFDDVARCLAGPEPGDARLARDLAVGDLERLLETFLIDFNI